MIDKQQFTELKAKYNIPQNGVNHSDSNFLYFILAKADLDLDFLNDVDWKWLKDNDFLATYELLKQKIQDKEKNIKIFVQENFKRIYNKYSFLFTSTPIDILRFKHEPKLEHDITFIRSLLPSILLKLDLEGNLSQTEIDYLKLNKLNEEKFIKLLNFLSLKIKYQVIDYYPVSPDDRLYSILKKLDSEISLTDKDIRFITDHNLNNLLEIHSLKQKKLEEKFIQLKEKYQATECLESSLNSPLYKILNNIELGKLLSVNEINWLNDNKLIETVTIADFVALKIKYKATENQDLSISSHLYKVLKKIDSHTPLPESDINFLKKKKLIETLNIAIDLYTNHLISQIESGQELNQAQLQWIEKNQRQDVINLGKTKHFKNLKLKYQVDQFSDTSPESQLYLILKKLDQNQRLDATEIAYLQDKNLFYSDTKIYIVYHTIEAQFYEVDYQKTGNKWNIPNISSHWRKADQPKKALKATENIIKDFDNIKDNKLKSAILTTRGGAFRDISQLDNAEKCARQAIEFQPSSHHPYTLMGAICYDRYDRYEGDKWFKKAIERGASPESIDVEIKKSIARMKDKNKKDQMIRDLLKQDSRRYSWANKYLSKNSHKKLR
ncbi:MAG: hypothetical protein AUK43_19745 [Oscillatoriales cyanobacterium CG2_30_40_61]|nr:MAG: hypothetical protein AUK43_19745 [Oscillatoriales cyanobacterium CG2_30_40_61]